MISGIVVKSVVEVLIVCICVDVVEMLAGVFFCVICVICVICVDVGPVKKSRWRTEGGLNNTLRNCDEGLY